MSLQDLDSCSTVNEVVELVNKSKESEVIAAQYAINAGKEVGHRDFNALEAMLSYLKDCGAVFDFVDSLKLAVFSRDD